MVIVVILPLSQLVVEQVNVVRDAVTVEQLVELLVVDPVRPLDLAVQPGGPRADLRVVDIAFLQVPMKLGLELGPIVGLDDVHPKRQPA